MKAGLPLLEAHHLTKSYSEGRFPDDISFVVDEGEILCLLSPSGCGKTTPVRQQVLRRHEGGVYGFALE